MEQQQRPADEIDLFYFFKPLSNGLKNIYAGLNNYLRKLQRNSLLFLALIILTAAIGYSLRYIIPRQYRTNAIFVSYNLPANFCTDMVNNLQELVGSSGNDRALASQLNITPNAASSIKYISTTTMDSLYYQGVKDSTASAFKINLTVNNPANIPTIEKGLEFFLENNEFSVKRKDARRKMLEALHENFVQKSKSLDSVKELVNNSIVPRGGGQGIILGQPISPVDVYKLQETFYKQQKELEEQLTLLQNVQVIQPFLRINDSNYPDFKKLFLYSIVIGFFAALILTPLFGRR